jgi:ribosomal protein S18 acetylase RimI-like enzyme
MNETPKTFEYRVATSDDHTDILAVLEEAASEIPVSLDTPENHEKIETEIIQCCNCGHSWVATDATGTVVGFVLARPGGGGAIYLPFIGVSGNSRRRGVFSNLIEKLKAKGEPLTASVLPDNQSSMADLLMKKGFTYVGAKGNAIQYRWSPQPFVANSRP